MADQQFCLRWNNHQSTLISVFESLLENGTLVDCTLAAEGQYLKAHKVVLSACSPYLETLLSQHYEKHPIVILKDVKFTELKSMMDYMYRGEVNISQDQLGTFLKAAESLQIKGLSDNGSDGDGRDVGSTSKGPPPRKNQPAPTSRPAESQRPDLAPASPAHRSRDGSISPSSRKRRRTRRNSQDDDGDSHLDSNSCDLPNQAQSTPIVPNIPAAVTSSITTTPIKTTIIKPEQTELVNRIDTSNLNSLPPESGLLKEKIEPISEPLLEPKTEYLDDANNDDSVEDLTLDDDDEMDEMDISNMSNMSNISRPGPSHGNDVSNQGFVPWQMGGNQSGTDEVFMAAQEAVQAHRGDSQGMEHFFDFSDTAETQQTLKDCRELQSSTQNHQYQGNYYTTKTVHNHDATGTVQNHNTTRTVQNHDITGTVQNHDTTETEQNHEPTSNNTDKEFANFVFFEQKSKLLIDGIKQTRTKERAKCLNCEALVHPFSIYYHNKFFCGGKQTENLGWKLISQSGHIGNCFKCKKKRNVIGIILHEKVMCGKNVVKCFFCSLSFYASIKRSRSSLPNHLKYDHGISWMDIESLVSALSDDVLHAIQNKNLSLPLSFQSEDSSSLCLSSLLSFTNPASNQLGICKDKSLNGENEFSNCDPKIILKRKKVNKHTFIQCFKCSTPIMEINFRLHKKYYCGKTPDISNWKMTNVSCICCRCKKKVSSRLIEFHVKYLCGKYPITVQCFYCPILFGEYNTLLMHMKNEHNILHFHLDLLSILPEAEDVCDDREALARVTSNKIVRHFFNGHHHSSNRSEEISKFNNVSSLLNMHLSDSEQLLYNCFYCEQNFNYVYESLDHMEEVHNVRHNTYDVLKESLIRI